MQDTIQTDFPSARPRALSDSMRRALQIRVHRLETAQAAAATEIENLYKRSDQLTLQFLERQQRLRNFRAILLNRGQV